MESFDEGMESLRVLIEEYPDDDFDYNEADTRHRIIDSLIHDCLGWKRSDTKIERRYGNTYSDYELGNPPKAVIEAKKTGVYFEFPAESESFKKIKSLRSIISTSENFSKAFDQTIGYCSQRGIQIGAISNGHQLIIFLGVRADGVPPSQGKCIFFNGLRDIEDNFSLFWNSLSPEGIRQSRLSRELLLTTPTGIPQKLSNNISSYATYRYPSQSQQSLRTLSDLLIEDVPNTPDMIKRFYEECYCESGALAKEALLSKSILSARYAAMFNPSEKNPSLVSLNTRKQGSLGIPQELIADALGKRPIVIIGDVGVGKTSFIRNLVYVKAQEEIKNTIYLYIDLGVNASLGQNLQNFLINEIEKQLIEKYEIDIENSSFIRGVFHQDLKRFENGIYGRLKQNHPSEYLIKEIEFLEGKTKDKISFLQSVILHLTHGRKKQFVLAIDNTDQRSLETQQEAFLAAQEFSNSWNALVLITLRPKTYFTSKASGSISAYPQRILTIAPPRIDLFLKKRLSFSLGLAEGRFPIESLKGISINLDSIALFLKALIESLNQNRDISELLSNITGGNLREVLELVKGFIGSANVDSDKIINIMREKGEYIIPLHEFSKQALLGEYSHYDKNTSLAYNLFDISYPDSKEHFLSAIIISYLLIDTSYKSNEGFINTKDIVLEMQSFGFVSDQVENALRRMVNKKLIETTERVTFDEGLQGLMGDMPLAFRATTIGAYHIQKWMPTFSYLDAMIIDTPIFESQLNSDIQKNISSFAIEDRYERTLLFRKYLSQVWTEMVAKPVYFDWENMVLIGQSTFDPVCSAIERHTAIKRNSL